MKKRGRPRGRSTFEGRQCKGCRTYETFVDKCGSYHWYHFEDGFLCERCNNRIHKNPRFHPLKNPLRMHFKSKSIQMESNPRVGVCNLCRNVAPFDCKKTEIHHEQYHAESPLRDTIEVCSSCHIKTTFARV